MTHKASLHWALLVDDYPHEPADLLVQFYNSAHYRKVRQTLKEEIDRFVNERKSDFGQLKAGVSRLIEALRLANYP